MIMKYNCDMKRVYLEITNACNLDCPFCTYEKADSFIDIEDIDDYLKQIRKYCSYIYLHILGEPLLHPQFNRILDLLDNYDMHLQLVSNGTLLHKYPDLLIHKCIRKLSISLHSINNINVPDSYFETVEKLIDSNTEVNIELRFYDTDSLDGRLKGFLDHLHNKYNVTPTSRKSSYRIAEHVYIYHQDLFRWPHIEDETISKIGYCHGGKDMIAINVSGDVTLCCLDPKGYNRIGNLKENSLDEILASGLYHEFLNNISRNRLIFPLCQKCSYRSRFYVENSLKNDR